MKRKIRLNRQLRIQKDKEKKLSEKRMAETILFEERLCCQNEYAAIADSPDYLYVYIHRYCGWSLYTPNTIVFLFDIKNESVKYAVERKESSDESFTDLEDNDYYPENSLLYYLPKMVVSLVVLGEAHFSVKDEIEEMYNWKEPELPHIFDGGGYVVFLKNGRRKRWICIQQEVYYTPYLWLLRFFRDIVDLMEEKE